MPRQRRTPSKDKRDQPLRIALRFTDHGNRRLREEELYRQLPELAANRSLAKLELMPLIESVKPERLAELVDAARERDPDYQPEDFGAWFQVVCPAEADPDELAVALRTLRDVETAYVMRPGPPPVNPADDPRSGNQGYLDAAPNGIDARYAWGFPGGDGSGIGFVDMEQGWNLNHEDLAAAAITLLPGGLSLFYFEHGTSVLGEVLMVDNAVGGVGIAPAASGRVVSQHRTSGSYNTADAILDAAANMAFGDVLLLEAQETDPVGLAYFWPVEIVDANYQAIRLATALGIVVVEAACNGGYALDPYVNLAGKQIFDRTSPDFRDSGAIMSGGGTAATPHVAMYNHGNRVDCYGWGNSIDTTTTNAAGTANDLYTTGFNGTSGASPIVAGAALIVQGLAQASLGYRFAPRELRELLKIGGTPSAAPATDGIGVMPNLKAIIAGGELNLAPDLYLRDYVGDTGNPTGGAVSQSPDIILRATAVANPQASFGPGSGTENDPALSTDAETGHDNFVYVRLLNRGGSDASAVEVDVYWSKPSTLVAPPWKYIGTASLAAVPSGNVLTVSDAITWGTVGPNGIPAPGHYCLIAVAGNAVDPTPDPTTFANFDQYVTYVRNNNNVAWRNFDVVMGPPSSSPPRGYYKREFVIPGAFDTSRRFEVEALGRLPEGSRVFLDMPAWFAESLRPKPPELKYDQKRRTARMPLRFAGKQRIGAVTLHARTEASCRLLARLPDKQREHTYEFSIRQRYKGHEVGRLTWRFGGDVGRRARSRTAKSKTSD
jgi:serine protease